MEGWYQFQLRIKIEVTVDFWLKLISNASHTKPAVINPSLIYISKSGQNVKWARPKCEEIKAWMQNYAVRHYFKHNVWIFSFCTKVYIIFSNVDLSTVLKLMHSFLELSVHTWIGNWKFDLLHLHRFGIYSSYALINYQFRVLRGWSSSFMSSRSHLFLLATSEFCSRSLHP